MPTFENGWICRECWSANREFDSRCYRCHKDRPEVLGEPVELAGSHVAAPGAPTVVMMTAEASAEDVSTVPDEPQATAARPGVRYCLRCGHQLLVGASFCTRCGTAAASEGAAPSAPTAQVLVASPRKVDRAPRLSIPQIRLPNLPKLPARELAGRVPLLYSSFVERHALAWEGVMSALAAAFVLLQLLPRWLPAAGGWAGTLSVAITGVFLVEFATRLGAAPDPRAFVRSHPIELAAVLPPLRALRILRLTWMKWLEPGWRSVAGRFVLPSLPARHAWRGRSALSVAWGLLLLLTAALVWNVGSSGGIAERSPLFLLLVMCVAAFGGVTGSMLTLLAVRHDARPAEASRGEAVSPPPPSASQPTAERAASPVGQSA